VGAQVRFAVFGVGSGRWGCGDGPAAGPGPDGGGDGGVEEAGGGGREATLAASRSSPNPIPPRHRKPSPPVAMGSAATSSPPSVTQEDLERVAVHMGDAAAASPPPSAKAKLKQEELKRVAAYRAVAGEPCGRVRHAAARCSSIYLPLPPRAAGHPHGGTRRGSAQGISADASDEGRHGARAPGHVVPAWPPPLPRARLGGGMPEDSSGSASAPSTVQAQAPAAATPPREPRALRFRGERYGRRRRRHCRR
jgi:hypothetical protein